MQHTPHSTIQLRRRNRLAAGIGIVVLAGSAAGCSGSDDAASTVAVAPPTTADFATVPTTLAATTSAPATLPPATATPVTAAPTTAAPSASTESPATVAESSSDSVPLSSTPVIAEGPISADAVDWESEDGKAAMKIDPAWTATGDAPTSGDGMPFTLEGEWTIGEPVDGIPTIVRVTTYSADGATLDNLGEAFWLTHKSVELGTSEPVSGPNGNKLTFFEAADGNFQTTGFVSIENGTMAVAEVSSHSDMYEAATAQAGPLLFTIMAQ